MNLNDFEEATARAVAELLDNVSYLSASDVGLLEKAIRYADAAHSGQRRKNGEPYITHPIAAATICTSWKLDVQALMAALMHDTMEDCGITKADIARELGDAVAEMVDGLTKLDKIGEYSREENQAESFRKMLLAMSRDVRVILVKLADRLHNMRTMADMPRSKWGRISKETLDVFAPIASRLGLAQVHRELEELSFKYHNPWRYQVLCNAIAKVRTQRDNLNQTMADDLSTAFKQINMLVKFSWREKTVYSIYRKMNKERVKFSNIHDIYGYRIVADQVLDCYTALGVLHQLYKPVPSRFKDFIALPKDNGYQSLHTTVIDPSGLKVEFQIRTQDMHSTAQTGIAANWQVRSALVAGTIAEHLDAKWLQTLLDIQKENGNPTDFWKHVKVGLSHEELFVFTPKNKITALPKDATALDFAYAINTSLGDRAESALINGLQARLSAPLQNGDVVEIVTSAQAKPNPDWLAFVRTGRALSRIRSYLKTEA
jgi:GTP diphosphokinase / guanosine-3',5'-bis(diphosphate) 3'-diphosphatase